MKRLFSMNSLRKRIISLFLLLTIVPLVITIVVMYFTLSSGFDDIFKNQQANMEHIIEIEFDMVAEELRQLTDLYSEREDFAEVFYAEDRQALLGLVDEPYTRLASEHGIEVLEFGDTDANVFLRAHNPEKYGDNKSEIEAIEYAISGESNSGLEFGSSGLSVRAFSPIQYNGEVIGTLQMGISDTFLGKLNEKLDGVTIDLYNTDGVIVESSIVDNIGGTINDAIGLQSIIQGEKVSDLDSQTLISYIPLLDPTESETIGIIGVSQDVSMIQQTKQQIVWRGLMMAFVLMIIVMIVSFSFSNSIANPIRIAAKSMVALSEGNLRFSIKEDKRKDEVGDLIESISVVRNNLHDTLSQVSTSSTDVTVKSEEMAQSSYEVKEGSEQIAMTMQEIARGTERQAVNAGNIAAAMRSFAVNIEETSVKGERIEKSSREVFQMTDEGQALMKSSEEQMVRIDEIVHEAVIKMMEFDKQSQEISKLVEVINSIANQTNLLALNAAIEAARAGESGKGFAVVADEVRKLAEQVAESVTEITGFVTNIQAESGNVAESLRKGYIEVEQGTSQIKATGETLNKISLSVNVMAESIKSIAENLSEITAGSQEMNSSIEEIAAVSEEAAAGVEQVAATAQQSTSSMEEVSDAAEKLASQAEEMNELVGRFKL